MQTEAQPTRTRILNAAREIFSENGFHSASMKAICKSCAISPGTLYHHFISKEEFEKDMDAGFFLEWAKVHDNYYGTSLKPILKELHAGKLVICDIDVQGHKIAREKFGSLITSVFITTPDQKSLKERLISRGTDSSEVIEKRLANAVSEMTRIREYDYVLINDDFKTALHDLLAIAYTSRKKMELMDLGEFISAWANIE